MTKFTFLRMLRFGYINILRLMFVNSRLSFHLLSRWHFIIALYLGGSLKSVTTQNAYTLLDVVTSVSGSSKRRNTISKFGCITRPPCALFLLPAMETY